MGRIVEYQRNPFGFPFHDFQKIDGFGVLEVMKQRNWLQEIPVIITSSEDDESFIQKAYELGVTDYIRRPFNLTVTQRRVSNALTLYARQKHLVHLAEEQVYEREKTNSTASRRST